MGAGWRRPLACCLLGCSGCRAGGGGRLLQQWGRVEGQGRESGPLSFQAAVSNNESEKWGCDSKSAPTDLRQHTVHCGSCLVAHWHWMEALLLRPEGWGAACSTSGMPSCSTTLVR